MKDSEKILLLVSVGVYNLSPQKAAEKFNHFEMHFQSMFDETYKVVCYREETKGGISIRLYNPNTQKSEHICQIPEDTPLDELRLI